MSEGLPALLTRVEGLLVALGRPYAVIGGAAMIARVRVRPTRDVDIVLSVDRGRVDDLLRLARAHGFDYEDDPASREIFEAGLVRLAVAPSREGGAGADLIFSDGPFLEDVIARATSVDLGPVVMRVATVEDLLLLKLEANRPIDIDDAIAIKDAFDEALDRAYLEKQADALGVRRALENLLASSLPPSA